MRARCGTAFAVRRSAAFVVRRGAGFAVRLGAAPLRALMRRPFA
ncbi:hypothetical protein ART_4103 [Arthrobacter sp. PAMC 25486]|nr:hypothetical protein ART_4103 [Arthrobacter sp. PAMC 25486]